MDGFFDQSENSMPRIGDQAPAFSAVTTQGTIYFPADYFGKWTILFSYSTDFTTVSTSEFRTFVTMHDDFNALNCELIGLSADRLFSQIVGLSSIIEKIVYKGTKDIKIKFPLIEDITIEAARKYGMIKPDKSNTTAIREVFIIDPKCMIIAIFYYPLSLGLNLEELKRVIVALQTEDEAISPPATSYYIDKELLETKKEGKKCYVWSFFTKELPQEKVVNVN